MRPTMRRVDIVGRTAGVLAGGLRPPARTYVHFPAAPLVPQVTRPPFAVPGQQRALTTTIGIDNSSHLTCKGSHPDLPTIRSRDMPHEFPYSVDLCRA